MYADLFEKNVIPINLAMMINVDVECKKHQVCEKDYLWNPSTCNCENLKYLANVMDNSTITSDEIIELYDEAADAKSSNKSSFNEKK